MTAKRLVPAILILALAVPGLAWALGFELGQTKEELKLKYDVSVKDHGTGRVTIVLKIEDYGRLKPVNSVDFYIPAKESHNGRGYYADAAWRGSQLLESRRRCRGHHGKEQDSEGLD